MAYLGDPKLVEIIKAALAVAGNNVEDAHRLLEGGFSYGKVVLYFLVPGQEIEAETHNDVDQELHVVTGKLRIDLLDTLKHVHVGVGEVYTIKRGTRHRVWNDDKHNLASAWSIYQ